MSTSADAETVYVHLPDEDLDVWRPVQAERVGAAWRILGPVPDDERWEFEPGTLVFCELQRIFGPTHEFMCLVAVRAA